MLFFESGIGIIKLVHLLLYTTLNLFLFLTSRNSIAVVCLFVCLLQEPCCWFSLCVYVVRRFLELRGRPLYVHFVIMIRVFLTKQ